MLTKLNNGLKMLDKKILVVFGDSNVWGAELKDVPEKQQEFKSVVYDPNKIENWPYHIRYSFSGILAERNNMKILNLSIPGSSNDTIFRRVNKFLQGKYPVTVNDCFVMIFWTAPERREFYKATDKMYLNYSPLWGHYMQIPWHKKFHKIYSKNMFDPNYDLQRTFDYMQSLTGLLNYKNIEFVQGYSIYTTELHELVLKSKLSNLISNRIQDSVHSITQHLAGKDAKSPNKYQCNYSHPNELGHISIADRYTELLNERQAQ